MACLLSMAESRLASVLNKLKAWALGALGFVFVIWWLITSSRREGKRKAELRQKEAALKNVEKANEVDREVDAMSDADKRERLRKRK